MSSVVGQSSHSMISQSFSSSQKLNQTKRSEMKTPEGDLGDVEADFQSLVNEMSKDSSAKKRNMQNTSHSFSSSQTQVAQSFSSSSSSMNSITTSSSSSSSSMQSSSIVQGSNIQQLQGSSNIQKAEGCSNIQQFQRSSNIRQGSNNSQQIQGSSNSQQGLGPSITGHPKAPPPPPPPVIYDVGVVKAMPAMVVPDGVDSEATTPQSEIILDRQMRVRDRIKKIEKQLSTEDPNAPPPDVILPRGRSGSIKNLADQFENQNENPSPAPMVNAHAFKTNMEVAENSCDFKSVKEIASAFSQPEEHVQQKSDVIGEFKSIKDVAAVFQDPIQPVTIKPPPAFMSEGEQEDQPAPVPVLPPATMRKTVPSPPPKPPAPPVMIPPPIPVVIPIPEILPSVPPRDVKPTEPPPVPWRKDREIKSETTETSKTFMKSEMKSEEIKTVINGHIGTEVNGEVTIEANEKQHSQTNGITVNTLNGDPIKDVVDEIHTDSREVAQSINEIKSQSINEVIAQSINEINVANTEIRETVAAEVVNVKSKEETTMKYDAPIIENVTPTLKNETAPISNGTIENSNTTIENDFMTTEHGSTTIEHGTTTTEMNNVFCEKTNITAEKIPVPAVVTTPATNDGGFEEALAEMNRFSETLSQTSTETESRSTSAETVVQQPIQYSAQVKCEVRSRVNTPDVSEQHQQQNTSINQSVNETKTSHQSRSETRSSSSSTFASAVSSSSNISNGYQKSSSVKTSNNHINNSAKSSTSSLTNSTSSLSSISLSSKTPPATGKPPKAETIDSAGPPKFTLLRSASTGSMASGSMGGMSRTGSDKDLPKFNVKKLKTNTRVWQPGQGDDRVGGPTKLDAADLPSFKEVPPVWQPTRAGSASPSLGRKEYRKVQYEGTNLSRPPSQESLNAPRPEESFAWKDKEQRLTTLPRVQNPTVTLLQKKRDDPTTSTVYTIKREYESEDEEGSRRFAVLAPRKADGVGPITRDGTPTSLKSGVKPEHQGEWYKRMFDSLHKVRDARYGGYMSEPEGYESDVGSSRYATLDRRRPIQFIDSDPSSATLPRDYYVDYGFFPRNANRYIHQPGRIENYVPGFSSLSEKELKSNPDTEVIIEAKKQQPPPNSINHRYGSKSQMSHALKESGYESDSTLVFKKRDDRRYHHPDPRKTSQIYRTIQRGGEIPLTGLQKPAPPRPKESPHKYDTSEVNIHYRSPIRLEQKEIIPDEELQRRQEEHMKKVYEQERRKKYLAELEDIERRRHTDNFTPLQKSPIPLNRYDDDGYGHRSGRTPEPKQVARALFNFTAQNKRELTFNKGEILTVRRKIDKNWYEGEFRGTVGIFPCNYVEVVPVDEMKTLSRKPLEGQARSRFNFQAQTSLEMTLNKGELVTLTRRVDENWYEGRVGNRKGIFPVTYVETIIEPGSDRPMTPSTSPMPRPALPAANLLHNGASTFSSPYSTLGRPGSQNESRPYNQSLTVNTQQDPIPYRALYNYKPQNDDELELLESDVVLVMEKCDDGWYVGTSRRTGLFGTFPGNYVDKI